MRQVRGKRTSLSFRRGRCDDAGRRREATRNDGRGLTVVRSARGLRRESYGKTGSSVASRRRLRRPLRFASNTTHSSDLTPKGSLAEARTLFLLLIQQPFGSRPVARSLDKLRVRTHAPPDAYFRRRVSRSLARARQTLASYRLKNYFLRLIIVTN